MKSSLFFLSLSCFAALAWSQAASTPPSTTPPPSTQPQTTQTAPNSGSSLRARGPEAVAQQDPNRVVATIGGKQLTAKQALDLLKPLRPEDRKRFESNISSLVQQLYMTEQIADQATKLKLDQQSPWKEQLEIARANILTQAYLDREAKSASSTGNGDPKAYYDSHPSEFEQVKLSGILVAFSPPGTPAGAGAAQRTEAQALEKANDLEKKIKAGGDFSALARTDSDHQQTSVRGGDFGTINMADPNIPAAIKTAVSKLQPGQVSEPVRVAGGFFIFKLDSHSTVPFEQAKASIVQKLENEKSQAALNQELQKYKIEVQDPDFFNASSAPRVPSLQRPPSLQSPPAKPEAK